MIAVFIFIKYIYLKQLCLYLIDTLILQIWEIRAKLSGTGV
ncbi:hypothetical protein Cha6605_1096 [Chamaesiphon minutus PCC 6605]|uniref:Uncharacterized protein n=1 Tax=Chamaesiphon minutus (strain ATCC 27169 / PCC 6605) TaxID=1173020 RepID=K9UD38_CHAP6|nr:hypothetical protein Cha6605_1096 [Chamaesiphon minutus PCC 6605]